VIAAEPGHTNGVDLPSIGEVGFVSFDRQEASCCST
jgi:hypothetical protein